jgi:tetratricopeptide (TPR) repeat protein
MQPPTPDQLFHAGLARHRAGDAGGAARFYQAVLQRAPHHAEALHLLGLTHAQAGNPAQARALIARALALAPRHAEAHYNLGNVLRQLGDTAEAMASWRRALALDPTLVKAHYNLGSALHHAGETEAAVVAYRAALHVQPRHADAQANLGTALMQLGRPREALAPLQAALQLSPDADAQVALAGCLIALGGFGSALAATETAIRLAPDNSRAWQQHGQVLHELGRADAALDAFARAVALAPQSPEPLVALAGAQQDYGAGEAARTSIAQALALDPAHSFAWALYGGLKRFSPGDPDIARLETLAGTAIGEDLIRVEFTLAKALMDAGAHDPAFDWLNRANMHHRARITYDVNADLARLAPACPAQAGTSQARPIFIVGMPRSGTTLVEQILASHPGVHAGGEMKHLDLVLMEHFAGAPDPAQIAALDAPLLDRLARDYCTRAAAPLGLRVTDKMPSNFRHAGLIHRLFPHATIVHCRRDPRDTCLSIYATHFAAGQDFAYDLGELGAYYRGYRDLMAQWRAIVPMVEIDYEALVADLEGEARLLVAACDLPWDSSCLDFHRTARSVRTASVNQVRQPLYGTSVERWRPYARHLEPLGL